MKLTTLITAAAVALGIGNSTTQAAEAVDYRDIEAYDACIQRALIGMFWPEVEAGRELPMEAS
jgi:hypothetical protein